MSYCLTTLPHWGKLKVWGLILSLKFHKNVLVPCSFYENDGSGCQLCYSFLLLNFIRMAHHSFVQETLVDSLTCFRAVLGAREVQENNNMLFVLVKSSQFHEERVKQVIKYNGPKEEKLSLDSFAGDSCQAFKGELTPVLLILFQKTEEENNSKIIS